MPGLGSRTATAAGSSVTPDRVVEVHFDVDENVLLAPPFSRRRYGKQIVHDVDQFPSASEVELLKSGYWIIRPLQGHLDKLNETTELGSAVMLLSEFNAISHVKQEPLYRTPTEVPGLSTGSSGTLATSANDLFFVMRRPAGASWNLALTVLSRIQPTLDSAHIVMDRVMEAKTLHDPNQGYLLRWQCAGTQRTAPDVLLNFYFGGPLFSGGWGEYVLSFHGDGACHLYEFVDPNYQRRMSWRYSLPHQVMSAAHTMRILPHMFRHCEFKSEVNEFAEPTQLFNQVRNEPYQSSREAPTVALYIANIDITGQPSESPNGWVTGPGYVRVDIRRDQRLAWQISRLQYPPTATLADFPFVIPCFADLNALMAVRTDYFRIRRLRPSDPSDILADITTTPVDAETSIPLSGDPVAGWSLPADPAKVAVQFEFTTADILLTPFLRGYTAELIGSVAAKTIGEKTGGAVTDYQITGPSADPTHETASLTIEDTLNELTSLRTRAGQNCRIRTSYDSADQTLKSTLFQGRVAQADAKLLGWDRGQTYPSPEWRELSITLIGEWQRLHDQLMIGQFDFSQDETADPSEFVNGIPPPWKISRVVEHLISYCGYQVNQIDVATIAALGTRIPLEPDSGGAWFPAPFTAVGDYIQRILRDYLGAYLTWDPNALNGAAFRGMWRVFLGPTIPAGASPLYSFTNAEPVPVSGVTLLGRTESYPADTTFIQKESFKSYPVPPEANALLVTTTGNLTLDRAQMGMVQCVINYRSYNPPGGPGLDDPDDPDNVDYLGRFVPLIITDPLITSGGRTAAERQALLDLFTRRVFNIALRGSKRLQWESPLALVTDASDPLLNRRRPLRFGDFIRVDGVDCILRSCDPSFTKDHMQFASYSADIFRAPD